MKHARKDYNRIQDPAGLIPEDEPVFLLRGQDRLAPNTVRHWAKMAQSAGLYYLQNMAENLALDMERWQDEIKGKLPDLPSDGTEVMFKGRTTSERKTLVQEVDEKMQDKADAEFLSKLHDDDKDNMHKAVSEIVNQMMTFSVPIQSYMIRMIHGRLLIDAESDYREAIEKQKRDAEAHAKHVEACSDNVAILKRFLMKT